MPNGDTIQDPPVKKTPKETSSKDDVLNLLSGTNGNGQQVPNKPKPIKQAAPTKVAESKDDVMDLLSGTVKKKDTDSGSGNGSSPSTSPSQGNINTAVANYNNRQLTEEDVATMNANDPTNNFGLKGLSPEGVKAYVQAHNGPKISDLYDQTYKIINEGIPPVPDTKINGQRQQLISAVKNGDQSAITTAKNLILTNLQQQVEKVKSQSIKAAGTTGATYFDPSPEQKQLLDQLNKKIQSTTSTLNDFAINTAANSKETQTQVKAEVSGSQRGSTPNIAAEDLGKTIEKVNGGLPNPNGNIQYERQRAGFDAIIQNKQMKINDLMSNGLKSKNQAMLQQAQQEQEELNTLKGRADNLINQFPDVAVTQVSRMIGDEINEHTARQGIITKGAVAESAARIEAQYPGFIAKYGKYINHVEEEPSLVPQVGFFGGLAKGLNEIQYGSAGFVAGLVGDKETQEFADKMLESPALKGTKQSHENRTIIDYNGKMFKEKEDNDYGSINWNSSMRFVGNSVAELGKWVVAETATEGLINLTGAGKLVNEAGKVVGKGAADYGKLFGASVITGYDSNYKLADSLIDDNSTTGDAKKALVATLTTMVGAGAFKLAGASPTTIAKNAVAKAIIPDIIKAYEENGWKVLPKNKLQDLMINTVIPKAKTFAIEQAKAFGEGGKVAAAQLATQKVNDFVGQVLNPKKANASTIDENIKSFVQQTLLMGLIGLPKSVVGGFDSPSMKDAYYEVGMRAPQYIERINDQLKDGEITQEKADQAIAATKTLQEEVYKAQFETDKDGKPLTVGQKKEIAIQNFRKRAAKGLEESGVPISAEKVNSDADDQIKNTKSQNTHLPLEETEAFKTASEVDDEGKEIGKPTSIEDIEDKKKYKYSKDSKDVTTTGLELLSHLPQSEENIEDPLKDVNSTSRSLKKVANVEPDKLLDSLVQSGEITYTDENGNPCAKEGLTTTGNPSFGGWEIVHDLKDKPSHEKGGVDLSIKGNMVEAEGRELVLKNKAGEMAIIPKKDRAKISRMISDNCEGCLNDYISTLPKNPDVAQEGGMFDKEKSADMGKVLEGIGVKEEPTPTKTEEKPAPVTEEKGKGGDPKKKTDPDKIPAPNYDDPKSRLKYAESFTKKYGPEMQGRGDTPLKVNEVPRGGSDTAKNMSTKIAKKFGIDPATLYSSSMEEGMSGLFKDKSGADTKHRKPSDFGYQSYYGDKEFPINGNESFGLPDFAKRFPELVKGGYLPKEFANRFRGKEDQFSANDFKTADDAMMAKAAVIKYSEDDVQKYASKNGIKLSPKAKEFFSLVLFNGGEGTAHQMISDYNKNGLLANDKFIDQRPTSGEGLKADSYKNVHANIKKRILMANALKSEGLF